MPNFYGGLKKFFNLKENTQKKDEALDAESGPDASQAELEEKLIGTQAEIKQQQLAPAPLEGLSEEKKPAAEQIVKDANTDLSATKEQSLNSLGQVEKLTFTAGIVDTSEILRGKSYRAASEKMTADKNELRGVKGFLEKIWKYNFAEQYLHETQRVDVKKKMIESGNLYIAENLTVAEKEAAQRGFSEAILARFIPDIKDMVEENLGEKREELKENSETVKIKDDLKKIINEYADGKLDEASFEGKKREVFATIAKSDNQETIKKGEMYVDNFLEIARQVKEIKNNIKLAGNHHDKLAKFDFDINLILGKAKEGVKTETHYNIAEKTVEKMRQTKLGSFVNETTLAVAVGLTYSVASVVSQRVLRSKVMAFGTLGLAAGVSGAYAGVKESQMQKRERQTLEARDATHMVDLAAEKTRVAKDLMALEYAKQTTSDKKELKKIEKNIKNLEVEQDKLISQENFLYKKKTAVELSASLETAASLPLKSATEVDAVLNTLADIEARLELSNERKIDLVSYSSLTNVESERQKLLKTKWQAKQQLQNLSAGISLDWEKKLKDLTTLYRQELLNDKDNGIEDKDKAFNKHKNKEVLHKVAQTVLAGATIGLFAQEVFAAFSDQQEGLVENLVKGDNRTIGDRDTALEALRNFITGHDSVGNLQEVAIDNGLVKLPANCSWLHNPNGSFNLLRGSEVLAENLKVNPDGSLTDEAKNILAAEHINVNASQYAIESGGTTAARTGLEEYVNKHPEDFKQISRGLWYGNDTPMYKGADGKMHGADLNELRAHWGGDHGTGINLKTNCYEMSAIKMTPDGSFQTVNGDKLSENATELIKEGKMKFLFSLSDGTQNHVIELPIDPVTGKISVERGSEYAKLLFAEKNGQAILQARFAEVATSSGIGKDGVEQVHVFATAVGEGLKGVDEIINTPPQMGTATALGVPRDWAVPPFVPVGWRAPLEPVKEKPGKKKPDVFATSYYDRYHGGAQKEDYVDLNNYRRSADNANILAIKSGSTAEFLGNKENLVKNTSLKGNSLDDYRQTGTDSAMSSNINGQGLNITLDQGDADLDPEPKSKRKGLPITLNRDNYDPENIAKKDIADLHDYKDDGGDDSQDQEAMKKYQKYSYIIDQLKVLENYDQQDEKTKVQINKDLAHFNTQRHAGDPLNINEYVGQQITRLYHQIDNILISGSKVGDKPFSSEFYNKAPLVKGVERAEEIVIILDSPIGDAVLTIPAVLAVQKYLALNKINKPIKLVASPMGMDLFACVRDQFPGDVELVNYEEMGKFFANDKKEKFVINAHKNFKDYDSLNLHDGDNKDLSRVMSVAWDSWTKEEVPKRLGLLEKYDAIPARIMRNFENMFGQKLFEDINKMDHYLEKDNNSDKLSAELKDKYKIKADEQIVVISAGSSVQPKEYEPEKWEAVISETLKKYPQAHIMFLEDPNQERWARYSPMVEKIISQKTGRFDLVSEPTGYLNAIMSTADVVVTPDTGLGHYASALGKPNIMLILGDPVRWSNAKTDRIMHKKARETYAKNAGTYSIAWSQDAGYYVNDHGEMIGSSNFSPELINEALEKYLKK